jgi:hypothetical protein
MLVNINRQRIKEKRRRYRRKAKGKKPTKKKGARSLMSHYKSGAKNRDISFELTEDEFRELTQGNCHYCGVEPDQALQLNADGDLYIYNGIDRLDGSKGYTTDNCVPCCKVCNFMKRNMLESEFIAHISKIMLHYVEHD